MTTIPRLLSVATAVPPIALRQPDVQRRLCTIFRERATEAERFLPVFDNAGIETRYSCVPLDWYEDTTAGPIEIRCISRTPRHCCGRRPNAPWRPSACSRRRSTVSSASPPPASPPPASTRC